MTFFYNPKNYLYLKQSVKQRSNRVFGGRNSSAALLENATGDDKVFSLKIGSRLGRLGASEPSLNNFVSKASVEVIKSEQTSLIKSKLFARLTRKLQSNSSLYVQIGLNAGYTHQQNPGKTLKINDSFFLQNFKGISNIGYQVDQQSKKKEGQKSGDNLGFDKYATLNLKVSQIECPLLSDLYIEPFIFANFALAPNRRAKTSSSVSWLGHHLRWASGIGLSMQRSGMAIEGYYNIYVGR